MLPDQNAEAMMPDYFREEMTRGSNRELGRGPHMEDSERDLPDYYKRPESAPNTVIYRLGNLDKAVKRARESEKEVTALKGSDLERQALKDNKNEAEALEKFLENLEKEYKGAVHMGEVMNNTVTDDLFRNIPPWPYQERAAFAYFDSAKHDADYAVAMEKIGPEAKPWFYRLASDLEHQWSNVRMLFATGGPARGNFDILIQMQALLQQETYHAVGDDFISLFSKEDPGLTNKISDKEKEKLLGLAKEGLRAEAIRKQDEWRMWSLGIAGAAQFNEDAAPGKESFMKLSKNQLKFIRLVWGDAYKPKESEVTKDGEIKQDEKGLESNWIVYKDKKGVDHTVPRMVGNWFSDNDKVEGRRKYLAKAYAVLGTTAVVGTGPEDERTLWDHIDSLDDLGVEQYARYVLDQADRILGDWKDPMKDIHRRLSERVVASWIMYDLGFMTAGRLGWHKEHVKIVLKTPEMLAKYKADPEWKDRIQTEKNAKGDEISFIVKKKQDSGGIYKAWDAVNGVYWAWRKHMYDATWKSATAFLSGTAHEVRQMFKKNVLGWAPEIRDYLDKDSNLQAIWNFWFNAADHDARMQLLGIDGNSENGYKADFDPEMSAWLQEKGWAWVTWVQDHPGQKDYLAIPMFFPHTLEIGIWEFLRLDTDLPNLIGKNPGLAKRIQEALKTLIVDRPQDYRRWDKVLNKYVIDFDPNDPRFLTQEYWKEKDRGKISMRVFDLYTNGIKPSELDWTKMNYETLNKYWVNMSMLVRYLKVMIDPTDAERDKDVQAFFGDISTMTEKELAKRIILTFRDVPKEMTKLVASLLPYAMVQSAANKRHLIGPNAARDGNSVSGFIEDCAKITDAFQQLPFAMGEDFDDFELPDYVNYNNDMAILSSGYMMRFIYIGQAAVGQVGDTLGQRYARFKEAVEGKLKGYEKLFEKRYDKQPAIPPIAEKLFKFPDKER